MEIERAQERGIHFQFVLEFYRLWRSAPTLSQMRFESVVAISAIALGQIEGRPFREAKLAAYLGVSRATLSRHLAEARSLNLLQKTEGGYWILSPGYLNTQVAERVTDRFSEILLKAAAELHKVKVEP